MIQVCERASVVDDWRRFLGARLPYCLHAVAATDHRRIGARSGLLLRMERLVRAVMLDLEFVAARSTGYATSI